MKRKVIKLFLFFLVIVLSLLFVASCNETPPENPPEENNGEKFTIGNLEIINDKEFIEFIFKSHPYYVKSSVVSLAQKLASPYPEVMLIDMYRAVNYDSTLKIKEYSVVGMGRTVACYAPKYVLENLFAADIESFIRESCNEYLFQDVKHYIKSNNLSYRDLKLIFCYGDKNDLKIINQDYVMIYISDILSAKSVDGEVSICAPLSFCVNEGNDLVIESDNSIYLGKKVLRLSDAEEKHLPISALGAQRSYRVDEQNGKEIVKINVPESPKYQIANSDFFDLILPAFISSEENYATYGALLGYTYTYDYEIIKEALKIY